MELSGQAHPGPPRRERPLTGVRGRAPADGEDLPQVLVLLRKALLQPLQLAQALAALVLHGAHVLDEVQLGLGGVAAQDTVVVAALTLHTALVLLQVLPGERRGTHSGEPGGACRRHPPTASPLQPDGPMASRVRFVFLTVPWPAAL